jgi:hypothetical protein
MHLLPVIDVSTASFGCISMKKITLQQYFIFVFMNQMQQPQNN